MITDHKRMVALFEFEGVPPCFDFIFLISPIDNSLGLPSILFEKLARSYLGNEANESQ